MSPVVRASMADVSTEYVPVEPGQYEMEVDSITEEEVGEKGSGRIMYKVKSRVAEPGDHLNKPVTDRIHIHRKDGQLNEIGLATLKRYFEAIVGEERANAEDADTDELIKGRFIGEVSVRTWENDKGEEIPSNEVKVLGPVD